MGERTGEMIAVECAVMVLITTTAELESIDLGVTSRITEDSVNWNRIMMFVFLGFSALLILILAVYALRTRRRRA